MYGHAERGRAVHHQEQYDNQLFHQQHKINPSISFPALTFISWFVKGADKRQLPYSFSIFNRKLFTTTETELNAIAAPAIIGFNKKPLMG